MGIKDPPTRFLVIGTHREDGGLYVWCGVDAFLPIQKVLDRGAAGQLVNHTTATELVQKINSSQSAYKFQVTILPIRDIVYERPSPILLPH